MNVSREMRGEGRIYIESVQYVSEQRMRIGMNMNEQWMNVCDQFVSRGQTMNGHKWAVYVGQQRERRRKDWH